MTPNPSIERTMTETLPIWRAGAAKCAITDFVERVCREGSPEFVAPPARIAVFDNEGKPVAINKFIGRRPILAFGNSDGDPAMLLWTVAGGGARFMGLVHHTDAEREWAYDRKSSIGRLNKALDDAKTKGWTAVTMKDDWKRVFAFDSK